ncbi:MAG: hypothetical protein J7639_07990 [Paenibacillaceae bacterium]|nr:hypothetical protein [Paenibacillaceae bacterium]
MPAILEPGRRQGFRLPMCAEPDNAGLELVVQVVVNADDPVVCMPVMVNGCWPKLEHERTDKLLFPCGLYTHHVAASGPNGPEAQRRQANVGYNYTFPVSLVKAGWNEIVVENGSERQIRIVCIELAIRQASPV